MLAAASSPAVWPLTVTRFRRVGGRRLLLACAISQCPARLSVLYRAASALLRVRPSTSAAER